MEESKNQMPEGLKFPLQPEKGNFELNHVYKFSENKEGIIEMNITLIFPHRIRFSYKNYLYGYVYYCAGGFLIIGEGPMRFQFLSQLRVNLAMTEHLHTGTTGEPTQYFLDKLGKELEEEFKIMKDRFSDDYDQAADELGAYRRYGGRP